MAALAHREVEAAVLAGCLIDPGLGSKVSGELSEEDFSFPQHRAIYRSVVRLCAAKAAIDLLSVRADLEVRGELGTAGGVGYLAELEVNLPDLSGFDRYLTLLQEATARRNLVLACQETAGRAGKGEGESVYLISSLSARLREIEGRGNGQNTIAPACKGFSAVRERLKNPAPRGVVGVPSGFPLLDKLTLGWCPGLIILAGRPGMGKTAFALGTAQHAGEFGSPTLFFSLEMGRDELGVRLVASATGIEFWRVRSGYLTTEERKQVERAMEDMASLPLLIDDSSIMTVERIAATARRVHAEHGIKMLLVDYLQLMTSGPGRRYENRNLEIGVYTRTLKLLSKELRIPVVLLAQLSRESERRSDRTPMLADLRDSGNIEQDADLVVFIHKDNDGASQLIIAKHRNGALGRVPVKDRLEFCRFDP